MRKIAIFGGTFNPIHNGHLHLCRSIAKEISFDQVILIPSCKPPHKNTPDLVADAHRLAMCRLAVQDDPLFAVSDLEIKRQGVSYTVDTIRDLKALYPDDQLYFLMGSDMLLYFAHWYCYEEILNSVILVAGAREQNVLDEMHRYHKERLQNHKNVLILPFEAMPMSSTQIRAEGELVLECLPEAVQTYIQKQGLYQGE